MDIPALMRKELVNELRYVAKKITEEETLQRKVFFYSAAYGIVRRVMNLSYDPQIDFLEFVLETSYNAINARMQDYIRGNETVPFIDGFFDKLATRVSEIASEIKKNEDLYKTLEHIVVLTHLTTGNGYYLYTKGSIKV